ncbi:glucose-1-phosphate cytidylyltransferase [Desertifilum sp. FACHB-1129]|uniref:Glucose-1-phosphate cytidylyltransferase n=2 Tax=Desertifilum tharense IPPAS B-1220 TaxID=1781255 RepID=A0A1E5QCR3_9CYAN|nr:MULTISPECIES: glucose-1-phosphate cytidylyltransferase [Desertifilum]MDA0208777.1 glucose-1-phosphate cytidylyltransferase [Cyanobacteria bacterium FC1]MBD2310979.1 glucose-1-phosphate cytidylyltransferase [Desertifilum sp. FACHB-1129]MBD2321384.1 glucose-1-phosphate cytidylyltransferase [Desertifilum sp. FACHB-866]MBD2331309.1 glucose-1-phosphate cytidylyltransferase [Desertifilum sp. FACHB-868]OEJ72462.1 glucose-1-phosphate cytidylyltransferase [Desertifilum tharense IPPAS B-1220]
MKVVILAGGLGTRLSEETTVKPKPMVEIGGQPMLWHIMNIYAAAGFKEFIVALGYKGEFIKNFFLNYYYLRKDFTISLDNGRVDVHNGTHEDWKIHLVDTGEATDTGGRLKRLSKWIGDEPFMMTYGDGVSNIDVANLVKFHRSHGKLATITAVRPPSRFGGLRFEGDLVAEFMEKPQIGEGWINGGFFVLEPQVLDFIRGDDTIFERDPLEKLAQMEQLVAYRHDNFWQCMDTLRDVRLLESLWQEGKAPWKVW